MAEFDPYSQSVTFLGADGKTQFKIPMPAIDAWNTESISISISYGAQLGAAFILLLVVLITTPRAKLHRPSNVLHITGLVICVIRMGLLCAFFPSPFNEFYNYWGADYSNVGHVHFNTSVAANISTLLMVIVIEAALMNQAWTMVRLWPDMAKYTLTGASAIITLATIGFRTAFTIIQSEAVLTLVPVTKFRWVAQLAVVGNALSVSWFCALFNVKLLIHLVVNRGLLPSYRSITPMEMLIMTNGILMIIPVIFASMEFRKYVNFEPASLALTSVVIMLPLGTLAAQRMAHSVGIAYPSDQSSFRAAVIFPEANSSTQPLKPTTSFTNSNHTGGTTPQVSIFSRCEGAAAGRHHLYAEDVELTGFDGHGIHGCGVRIDRDFEQHEERL